MRKLVAMMAVVLAILALASAATAQERPDPNIKVIGRAWDADGAPDRFDWAIAGDAEELRVEAEDPRVSGRLSFGVGPVTTAEGSISATLSIRIDNDAGAWNGDRVVLGGAEPGRIWFSDPGVLWVVGDDIHVPSQNVVELVGSGDYQGLTLTLYLGDADERPWGTIREDSRPSSSDGGG
jgi:hypothetical protein